MGWTLMQVAAGGALGATLRFLTGLFVGRFVAVPLPFGTFVVNVSGCLAIGFVFALLGGIGSSEARYTPFFVTGFLGAYTTMSAFALDTWILFDSGRMLEATVYVVSTVVLSLLAFVAGISAGRLFIP